MFKNVAAKFIVFAFDATTNVPKTGDAANITAYVSKDYGTVTVLADTSATEMDATNAPGYYLFDAAQGETNGDILLVSGKSATANIKVIGAPAAIYTRPTTGWLAPATAGRALAVDASGRALSDVDTIKTNPVVNAGTFTFPANATGASTTNITAGTITTVTTVTNQLTAAAIATGVWTDTVAGDFTTANSVGKSVMNGVALGTGLTITAVSGAVGSVTGNVGGNVAGSVASVTGAVGSVTGLTASDVGAIKTKTDQLTFTVANKLDANIRAVNSVTVNGVGSSGSPWGP